MSATLAALAHAAHVVDHKENALAELVREDLFGIRCRRPRPKWFGHLSMQSRHWEVVCVTSAQAGPAGRPRAGRAVHAAH